jgi:TfdA family taurine catabolism dioxygenase TauD
VTRISAAASIHNPGADIRAWDASLDRDRICCQLSAEACGEAVAFVRSIPPFTPPAALAIEASAFPHLRHDIEACRARVDSRERIALLRPVPGLDFHGRRLFAWIVANMFGEPVPQNTDGDRIAVVYARPGTGRIADGARYHQTREGGAVHNDNVSLPDRWEYLVFSCIRPAWIGGESILISAFTVHDRLLAAPEALGVLQSPFWWEYRGLGEQLFQAPIITYSDAGEPQFRYLRRYLESAHLRAAEPLTLEQRWALDTLDAILDQTHLQFRTVMHAGDILVANDSQVLHARTAFCDPVPHGPMDAITAAAGPYRFFDRVWAKKRPA